MVLCVVAVEGTVDMNCWVHSRDSGAGVAGTGRDDTGCSTSVGRGQRCFMRSSSSLNAARCSLKVMGAGEQGKEGVNSEVVGAA